MKPFSLAQLDEARRALDAPLFADVAGDAAISFEFFPPRTEKMDAALWDTVQTLAPLGPRFVSVTYGADGSTRERTHETVARIANEAALPTAAHLTCVGADKTEIGAIARGYWAVGVRHIVALRGDQPQAGQKLTPHPNGFANAAELAAGLKEIAPFEISVAAYPECHPDLPALKLIWIISRLKSTPGQTVPSPSFSSRPRPSSAFATAPLRPGLRPRLCRASCRSQTSRRPENSLNNAGQKFPPGWTGFLKGSTTTRRPASLSPLPWPQKCAANFMPGAHGISIFIR